MAAVFQPFPMFEKRRAQAWRYQPQYRRPRHFHDQPELNIVTRGVARLSIGQSEVELQAGQAIGLLPGCEHELLTASADLELFVVGFEPQLIANYLEAQGELPSFSLQPLTVDARLLEQVRKLCLTVDSLRERLVVESHLLAAAGLLSQSPSQPTLGWNALSLLAEDPLLSRVKLTKRLASNQGDVSRAVRRDTGLTLPQYKNRLRVLRFLRHLDDGLALRTASGLAGFGSYSQCHRAFVQVFGCGPRDFSSDSLRWEQADHFEPAPETPALLSPWQEDTAFKAASDWR